jgi:hypothetical protein
MASRVGKSFADLISLLNQLQAGLKEGADSDPKQKQYLSSVTNVLNTLTSLDDEQEKAKAKLHTVSQKLNASTADARKLVASVVSYLESEMGKSSPQLQRYGIARRIPGRKTQKEPQPSKA